MFGSLHCRKAHGRFQQGRLTQGPGRVTLPRTHRAKRVNRKHRTQQGRFRSSIT